MYIQSHRNERPVNVENQNNENRKPGAADTGNKPASRRRVLSRNISNPIQMGPQKSSNPHSRRHIHPPANKLEMDKSKLPKKKELSKITLHFHLFSQISQDAPQGTVRAP